LGKPIFDRFLTLFVNFTSYTIFTAKGRSTRLAIRRIYFFRPRFPDAPYQVRPVSLIDIRIRGFLLLKSAWFGLISLRVWHLSGCRPYKWRSATPAGGSDYNAIPSPIPTATPRSGHLKVDPLQRKNQKYFFLSFIKINRRKCG
jgi:hypothetical protein